jgi:DNA-binding NtrC family response regulator
MLGLSVSTSAGAIRREFPGRNVVILGGAAHCDIVLEDPAARPEHARLERAGDGVRLVALDGRHPVDLNGDAVLDAVLCQGDRLRVGAVEIRVETIGERRARLATLGAFADAGGDEGPVTEAGRPRILFDPDEAVDLTALPDPAHETRFLRRVLQVNKRLARARAAAELLETFLDAALGMTGAERALLVAPSGDGVTVVCGRDAAGQSLEGETGYPLGLVHDVLADGRPRVVEDFRSDAVHLGADPDEAPQVRALACVALPGEGAHVLYLDSRHEADLFVATDADLLTAFAEQASLALERVRLQEDNLRQQEDLVQAGERSDKLNRRLVELLERRTVELEQARADLALVDEQFRHRYPEIVGRGPATCELLRQVDRVADTNVPVLFEGESGTGKELVARALHASSSRAASAFVAENCAALPETLLENELFGHEQGAFTGADASAPGLFERADEGTLFLDEVGDMSPSLQKRLLRVLQEGEVRRVGGSEVRKVDVRIVTATNRDLSALVREGRFREDLYYRLAVVKVRVPPLRERREDIPDLLEHFLRRFGDPGGGRTCSEAALNALVRYQWPGNVRQLENEIRRAVALCSGQIEVDVLSPEVRDGRASVPELLVDPTSRLEGRDLRSLVEELEVRVVRAMLERENGNITRTARALGLSRLGLRKKMQRYGLEKGARA